MFLGKALSQTALLSTHVYKWVLAKTRAELDGMLCIIPFRGVLLFVS